MDSRKKKVIDYIDRHSDEVVGFLCEFIAKRSINRGTAGTGDELSAQDWLAERLEEMGYDVVDRWFPDRKQKRPNVVGIMKGKGAGRALILQGHVDVVPVPDSELDQWQSDPWTGTVRNGRVYGRGASDTKAGNTGMIWAAKAIRECGL
jgi:acetylornithine deacetylase